MCEQIAIEGQRDLKLMCERINVWTTLHRPGVSSNATSYQWSAVAGDISSKTVQQQWEAQYQYLLSHIQIVYKVQICDIEHWAKKNSNRDII